MRIGIIAAMDSELAYIAERMTGAETLKAAGRTFYRGKIGGGEVTAVVGGIGIVNTAITAQLLIDRFHAEALINTGIAGALDRSVHHLDMVVAEGVRYHGVCEGNNIGEIFPYANRFICDGRLKEALAGAADGEVRVHRGDIVTGDAFISDSGTAAMLFSKFSAKCVEMEGAAVGHTAFLNEIPFAVIRCISDRADDDATADYESFEVEAARRAASMVVRALESLDRRG